MDGEMFFFQDLPKSCNRKVVRIVNIGVIEVEVSYNTQQSVPQDNSVAKLQEPLKFYHVWADSSSW